MIIEIDEDEEGYSDDGEKCILEEEKELAKEQEISDDEDFM